MDSLLLVSIVIGVIMILAGLARMKRKNQEESEDVDPNLLFDKKVGGETKNEEQNMDAELSALSSIIAAEKETKIIEPKIKPNVKNTQPHNMFSLFDKFSVEKNKQDSSDSKARIDIYKKNAPNWVIVLNIVAPKGSCFVGLGLIDVIKKIGFTHGEMNLFHYIDKGLSAFSLANIVKPGTFDLQQLDDFTTPGVSLFIQYPNQNGGGVASFDMLFNITKKLAEALGGEVRDEKRSVLTHSAIEHIREKITAYDLKWRYQR